jgi:hypothetical protein
MTLVLEIALGIILAVVVLRMIGAFAVLLITSEIARGVIVCALAIPALLWFFSYHPH